jgi:hypothetical protein
LQYASKVNSFLVLEAIGDQALTVSLVFGTLVFAAAAKIDVLPRLLPSDPACRRLQPPA